VLRRRRFGLTGWQIVSTVLILALIGAVLALAVLNSSRSVPRTRAAPTPASVLNAPRKTTVTPFIALTPTAAAGAPAADQGPTRAALDRTATAPLPQQSVRVANTGGAGVVVHQEPGPQSPTIGMLSDGTHVTLTGGQQTVAARLWHEIEDRDLGLRGWVSSEFLELVP
jgi:hypothetical protein